jgi:hypothetical protein
MLDRYFLLDKPVLISAMGVPSASIDAEAGYWHGPWSEQVQSSWVARVFAVAMSKPHVESIFWTDLFDCAGSNVPMTALIDEQGQPKAALKRLVSMRRRLRKPLGKLDLIEKKIVTSPSE